MAVTTVADFLGTFPLVFFHHVGLLNYLVINLDNHVRPILICCIMLYPIIESSFGSWTAAFDRRVLWRDVGIGNCPILSFWPLSGKANDGINLPRSVEMHKIGSQVGRLWLNICVIQSQLDAKFPE